VNEDVVQDSGVEVSLSSSCHLPW